jgi:uncharacterized protein
VVVHEVDAAAHSAQMSASGKDTKGAGTARATVVTRLEPAGEHHTRMLVTSDLQLTGKVASFGRGGAINDVATRLFGEFADCLRATLEAESAPDEAVAAAGAASAGSGPAPAEPAAGAGAGATASSTPVRAGKPLEAGSLVGTVVAGRLKAWWQAVAAFFRRLFGRRPAT